MIFALPAAAFVFAVVYALEVFALSDRVFALSAVIFAQFGGVSANLAVVYARLR